jgi:hypothetical protein
MSRKRRRVHSPKPGKGRVTFVNEQDDGWREELAQSQVFMALASPAWLRQPRLWEHIDYARQLGKPFRIVLLPGTVLPEGLFAGVRDLEIQPCATPEEAYQYVRRVLQERPGADAAGEGG